MDISTHTIAALSTPPGRGALAVIRLSGDGAQDVFAGVIIEQEKFKREPAHRIGIYTIVDIGDKNQLLDIDGYLDVGAASCRPCFHRPPYDNGNPKNPNVPRETSPQIIDEVTAIKYNAPRSFTGEDMVEIFCHGGAVIPQKILDRLFRAGARAAGRGEFSRRAWVNGKMDLLKAESIASLIDCETEKRLESAQLAYSGKQLKLLETLKRRIINILSDIETQIEFAEDNDFKADSNNNGSIATDPYTTNNVGADGNRPEIDGNLPVFDSHQPVNIKSQEPAPSPNKRELERIIRELEEELRRSDKIKTLDDGIIVALAGPPNAGKSSLFNEILGYDRSIVHDAPGTTRDAVSEKIVFDGMTVKLFDCAGIRDTDDAVELRGIERAMSAVKDAHVVLWVTSAAEPFGEGEREGIIGVYPGNVPRETIVGVDDNRPVLVVINKIDLIESNYINAIQNVPRGTLLDEKKQFCDDHALKYIETSLTEKINTDELFNAIKSAIHNVSNDICTPEIIVNQRHHNIIASIVSELQECLAHFDREEISAHYLKKALDLLAEFLGHVAGDEVLNEIFGKFCIGK